MIPFGETLRKAREAKGLTLDQVAKTTHVMAATLQDLENEDFSNLAAPIYGRGFVRLYCEAVGLDPKPLVDEFMEIYNGNYEPTIRERTVAPAAPVTPAAPAAPEPVPTPAPVAPPAEESVTKDEPLSEVPPVSNEPLTHTVLQPGLFDPPPPPRPATFDAPAASAHSAPLTTNSAFSTTAAPDVPAADETPATRDRQTFARYASPLSERTPDMRDGLGSPLIWRWAILGIVLALVLWGIVAGVRMLYRATTDLEVNKTETATAIPATAIPTAAIPTPPKPQPVQAAKPAKKTGRTPQNIPPLYLDDKE